MSCCVWHDNKWTAEVFVPSLSEFLELALVNPNKTLGTLAFHAALSFAVFSSVYLCLCGGPGPWAPGMSLVGAQVVVNYHSIVTRVKPEAGSRSGVFTGAKSTSQEYIICSGKNLPSWGMLAFSFLGHNAKKTPILYYKISQNTP